MRSVAAAALLASIPMTCVGCLTSATSWAPRPQRFATITAVLDARAAGGTVFVEVQTVNEPGAPRVGRVIVVEPRTDAGGRAWEGTRPLDVHRAEVEHLYDLPAVLKRPPDGVRVYAVAYRSEISFDPGDPLPSDRREARREALAIVRREGPPIVLFGFFKQTRQRWGPYLLVAAVVAADAVSVPLLFLALMAETGEC